MNKQEFIGTLSERLSGLPEEDRNKSIEFYSEMIDDRIDDGMSEEDAVKDIGNIDDIVNETIGDVPLTKIIKEKATPKRKLGAWEIVLLVLGFPLWFSLLVAAASLVLAFYIVLLSLIIVLFAIVLSFFALTVAELLSIFTAFGAAKILVGVFHIGLAIAVAGLGILMLAVSIKASAGILMLGKKILVGIKRLFVGGDKK